MATITELVTKFSFKGNLSKLEQFNKGLGGAVAQAAKVAGAVKAMQLAINAFTIGTMASLAPLANLSNKTGIATDRIQELEYATIRAGGSGEELKGTLANLSQKIVEAGTTGSADFFRLGVSVRDVNGKLKSADAVLLDVGQKLKNIKSDSQRVSIASKLGIDAGTLSMITKSRSEISALTDEAKQFGLVTREQAAKITQFNASISSLKFAMSAIQNQVAIALSPELKNLSDGFRELIKDNKEWIKDGIVELSRWIKIIGRGITRVTKFLWDFAVALTGSEKGAMLLGAAIALLLSPITATMVAIAAIILIVDDLIVAFKGGKSVIRDFFLEFFGVDIQPILQGLVKEVKRIFTLIQQLFKDLFDGVKDIFSGIGKLLKGDFIGAFKDIYKGITKIFSGIGSFLMGYFSPLFKWLKNSIWGLLPDWAKWVLGKMGITVEDNSDGGDSSFSDSEANAAKQAFQQQSLTPNNMTNNNSYTQGSRVVNTNVNVAMTTNDPQLAGESIKNTLEQSVRDAGAQFSAMGGL